MATEVVFDDPADSFTVRPQWLVSVRSEAELQIATDYPIDILDLKEPRDGPLSPAPTSLWEYAASVWQESLRDGRPMAPLSAALGERDEALSIVNDLPPQFAFAKVGPSGTITVDRLIDLWNQIRSQLPPSTEFVAVAYADHHEAHSPSISEIIEAAHREGIQRFLIDTFTKDGRSSLSHLTVDQLSEISALAKERDLWWALAGSVRCDDVPALHTLGITPDCIGVRGDVCESSRGGELSPTKLKRWSKILASSRPPQAATTQSRRLV